MRLLLPLSDRDCCAQLGILVAEGFISLAVSHRPSGDEVRVQLHDLMACFAGGLQAVPGWRRQHGRPPRSRRLPGEETVFHLQDGDQVVELTGHGKAQLGTKSIPVLALHVAGLQLLGNSNLTSRSPLRMLDLPVAPAAAYLMCALVHCRHPTVDLSHLASLRHLHLDASGLGAVKGWAALKKLQRLELTAHGADVQSQELPELRNSLSRLTGLRLLQLTCGDSSLPGIRSLFQLRCLSVVSSQLQRLPKLSELTQLKHLRLSCPALTELPALSGARLISLELSGCSSMLRVRECLSSCSGLTKLDLRGCQFIDFHPDHLPARARPPVLRAAIARSWRHWQLVSL